MQVSSNIDEILNLRAFEGRISTLQNEYQSAQPYGHIVLDDVLTAPTLEAAYRDFAGLDLTDWTNYLHVNERKFANRNRDTWGETLREIHDALSSPRFLEFLSQLTGIAALQPDPAMDGGGLHRTTRGAHLNIHADFTAHHTNQNWRRRVNLLLYLNREWEPEWGGELELWDRDVSACQAKVAPIGNRIFLFTTDEFSFHGHPEPLNFPEGIARQSLALYYFTHEEHPLVKSTNYRARPGDGIKRLTIYLDKQALALYDVEKRRFKLSDKAVSSLLGRFSRKRR